MTTGRPSPHAAIPAIDRLLAEAGPLIDRFGRPAVTAALRDIAESLRERVGKGETVDTGKAAILARAETWLATRARPSPKRVFNLTGTVLHTNLGRAPLAPEAVQAITGAAGACNLEYDLASGQRGDRDDHVADLLCRLTGAEAAMAVNNNAAAVLLALNSLARRKEVPVSRGELIEIGGAFRLPDVIARAGCKLVEVGTTNRTHITDFESAISRRSALLLKVHTSNYAISGFTAAVSEAALAALAHAHDLPAVVDLGSGSLIDLSRHGLPRERTPRQSLADGADLVTFSGDKLLGGPQAGLIVGRKALIDRLRRNPLRRALRLDKTILAGLRATLQLYTDPDRLAARLPALAMLTMPPAALAERGRRLLPLAERVLPGWDVRLDPCASQIGSGALPVDSLESVALVIRPADRRGGDRALKRLAARLRALPIPVIGRIHDHALWLDLRGLDDADAFAAQLAAAEPLA